VTHCTDEELTWFYYGEGRRRPAIERHLDECAECAALYREIAGTLALVGDSNVPERSERYGLEVWQRIRHQLPERRHDGFAGFAWFRQLAGFPRIAAAGAIATLLIASFIAGRMWRQPNATPASANSLSQTHPANALSQRGDASDRILLASVADHLDRSERVLTDIMNAPARSNISTEQGWAEDLLQANRLYRQDAADAGEQSVAAVLDDLERNLMEIVHSPSPISAADLEQLHRRIDAAALLFKVRVMGDELRRREQPPAVRTHPPAATRPTS
jgi:hypothetical protein